MIDQKEVLYNYVQLPFCLNLVNVRFHKHYLNYASILIAFKFRKKTNKQMHTKDNDACRAAAIIK